MVSARGCGPRGCGFEPRRSPEWRDALFAGEWPNGRAAGSGPAGRGSTPRSPTPRRDRAVSRRVGVPGLLTGLAQMVEHWSPKPSVVRSSRAAGAWSSCCHAPVAQPGRGTVFRRPPVHVRIVPGVRIPVRRNAAAVQEGWRRFADRYPDWSKGRVATPSERVRFSRRSCPYMGLARLAQLADAPRSNRGPRKG